MLAFFIIMHVKILLINKSVRKKSPNNFCGKKSKYLKSNLFFLNRHKNIKSLNKRQKKEEIDIFQFEKKKT